MSARGIVLPTTTETSIHLYRHLLREASYLHPVARAHVADRICQRFRHHVHTADPKAPLRQGRHHLRFLRAVNSGDLRRMRRVLLAVFGRIGPGRRELSERFVKKEPPRNLQELEKAIQDSKAEDPQPQDWLAEWDQEKIKQLAMSQAQQGLEMAPRKLQWPQAKPERTIPTETAWGKPLSPQAYRSKLLKRWKILMNKVLFPIPQSKWDLLRDLSEGKLRGQEWDVPPRRTPARPVQATEDKAWPWEQYAQRRVQIVDRDKSRRNRLLSGEVDDTSPVPVPPIGQHRFTSRLWRRLFADIWRLSATAEKKDDGKDWKFTWGQVSFQVPQATPGQMEFFAGTDGRKKSRQQAPKKPSEDNQNSSKAPVSIPSPPRPESLWPQP